MNRPECEARYSIWTCNRKPGHAGPHIATITDTVEWEDE